MKMRFISPATLLYGLVASVFEKFLARSTKVVKIADVEKVKTYKIQNAENENNISLYKTRLNQKIIVKSKSFIFKHLSYWHLIHEATVLSFLTKVHQKMSSESTVRFPTFTKLIEDNYSIALLTEFCEGKTVDNYSEANQIKFLNTIINYKLLITDAIKKSGIHFPKRPNVLLFFSFPFYFIQGLIKDNSNFLFHIKNAYWFFLYFNYGSLFKTQYLYSHKDLHQKNIIINSNSITLLDPEVSVLAQKETDLSIISRFFFDSINIQLLIQFLRATLPSKSEKSFFISLSIYYCYQNLATESRTSSFYKQTIKYLESIRPSIIEKLIPTRSLAENVYNFSLRCIRSFTSLKDLTDNSFILCYHSLGDDCWRFTTPVSSFIEQIQFLKKNFKIMPLNKFMTSNKRNAVSITFDDGYSSVYQYAFPILKALNLTATVFIIGNNTKVNRRELDNDLPLLTKKQIKVLVKNGWEIGYHTHTHSNLSSLTKKQLIHEIKTSKKKVEKELGLQLTYFAYPRGYYNNEIVAIVNEAGYKAAFTVNGGISHHNNLLISRVPMEGKIDLVHFEGLTSKIGLYFSALFMKFLSIKQKYFSIDIVSTT